jgi:hypothetical protein
VVLDEERRMEPEAFGLDAGLDDLPEAAARVAVGGARRLGTAEQAEAHRLGAATGPGFALLGVSRGR